MKKTLLTCLLLLTVAFPVHADLIQTVDQGYLETVDGQLVLHLKGSPYEIGYQHGKLLKDQIENNIHRFISKDLTSPKAPKIVQDFLSFIPQMMPYIPNELLEEMEGIAEGSNIPYDQILLLNLFPEMFHCCGITVCGKATENQTLYHVRVLDYKAANHLQDTAVLLVVEPQDGHAFLNVTYAGFIGSVTGMNDQKIAVGEIGGKGYGSWNGLPMAFLIREILQKASSLEDIQNMLKSTPRTCEYYYVFSDGKSKEAFAAYATNDTLTIVNPGTPYFLPLSQPKQPEMQKRPCHLMQQPEDCILLAHVDKFPILLERIMKTYGQITVADLQEAIKQPVAQPDNLHNAIFAPESLEVWISHAGPNNEVACDQPYHHFGLIELLGKQCP